jgi:hypothetical protein
MVVINREPGPPGPQGPLGSIGNIIRGKVLFNGGISNGTGFTVEKIEAGVYKVTFTAEMASIPDVLITCEGNGNILGTFTEVAKTGFTAKLRTANTGALVEATFAFAAIPS